MLQDNYMLPKFYFINLEFSLNQFFPAFQLEWFVYAQGYNKNTREKSLTSF